MPSNSPNICALILAGGLGSRMEYQDKGLLQINGISFVEHIARKLKIHISNIYISTNRNSTTYQTLGFQCINDLPFPSEGPLCAIASGLEKIKCDYLMIVPCDSPNIPNNLINILYEQIKEKNADIASLSLNGKIEPLFSLINTRLHESLKKNVLQGLRKTHAWIESENHVLVESKSVDEYQNINSKEDFLLFIGSQNSINHR